MHTLDFYLCKSHDVKQDNSSLVWVCLGFAALLPPGPVKNVDLCSYTKLKVWCTPVESGQAHTTHQGYGQSYTLSVLTDTQSVHGGLHDVNFVTTQVLKSQQSHSRLQLVLFQLEVT